MVDHVELAARARWVAAEDRLYPSLVSDPDGYQRVLPQIQAVLARLRTRCHDLSGLLAAESEAAEIVAAACPDGPLLSPTMLIELACAMRAREIAVAKEGPS